MRILQIHTNIFTAECRIAGIVRNYFISLVNHVEIYTHNPIYLYAKILYYKYSTQNENFNKNLKLFQFYDSNYCLPNNVFTAIPEFFLSFLITYYSKLATDVV